MSYSILLFGSVCNGVANARKFFAGLATVLQTLSIPELPKLTADDQFFPLGRLYAAHNAGVDAERATEGDDFFCSLGVQVDLHAVPHVEDFVHLGPVCAALLADDAEEGR